MDNFRGTCEHKKIAEQDCPVRRFTTREEGSHTHLQDTETSTNYWPVPPSVFAFAPIFFDKLSACYLQRHALRQVRLPASSA